MVLRRHQTVHPHARAPPFGRGLSGCPSTYFHFKILFSNYIKSPKFLISPNFSNPLRKTISSQIYPEKCILVYISFVVASIIAVCAFSIWKQGSRATFSKAEEKYVYPNVFLHTTTAWWYLNWLIQARSEVVSHTHREPNFLRWYCYQGCCFQAPHRMIRRRLNV